MRFFCHQCLQSIYTVAFCRISTNSWYLVSFQIFHQTFHHSAQHLETPSRQWTKIRASSGPESYCKAKLVHSSIISIGIKDPWAHTVVFFHGITEEKQPAKTSGEQDGMLIVPSTKSNTKITIKNSLHLSLFSSKIGFLPKKLHFVPFFPKKTSCTAFTQHQQPRDAGSKAFSKFSDRLSCRRLVIRGTKGNAENTLES